MRVQRDQGLQTQDFARRLSAYRYRVLRQARLTVLSNILQASGLSVHWQVLTDLNKTCGKISTWWRVHTLGNQQARCLPPHLVSLGYDLLLSSWVCKLLFQHNQQILAQRAVDIVGASLGQVGERLSLGAETQICASLRGKTNNLCSDEAAGREQRMQRMRAVSK